MKFDPARPEDYPAERLIRKLDALRGKTWDHGLGDGHASERLVDDLVAARDDGTIRGHRPRTRTSTSRARYREDGLPDAMSAERRPGPDGRRSAVVVPVYNEEADARALDGRSPTVVARRPGRTAR